MSLTLLIVKSVIMKATLLSMFISVNLLASINSHKNITPKKVVTTIQVLTSLAQSIGGDLITAKSLSTALEDPHFIKPKPSFKQALNEADIIIYIGRDLEPWLNEAITSLHRQKPPLLLKASEHNSILEIPPTLSRNLGDIHKEGNPHVWLSFSNALIMAANIKTSLISLDPEHKAIYEQNFNKFKQNLASKLFGNELVNKVDIDLLFKLHQAKLLTSYLKDKKLTMGGLLLKAKEIDYTFLTYHKVWSYLAHDFALNIFAQQIEEKSGIPPTAKYYHDLVTKAKASKVRHIVAAQYYQGHSKLINKLAHDIGGKATFIAIDCINNEDYITMIERIINMLISIK